MLNKLSFNLMNELNESETNAIQIKKKVFIESDKVTVKSLKEGFKLGEKAEIIDTCERRGQPIALVNLSKAKGWDEYVIAFGYTTENDEVSWNYGYYYYDEESAKEAFEKVKAGGNLSESEDNSNTIPMYDDYIDALSDKFKRKFSLHTSEDGMGDLDILKNGHLVGSIYRNDDNKYEVKLKRYIKGTKIADTWQEAVQILNSTVPSSSSDSTKSEDLKEKPIVEAAETEVKDLQVIKEQGNIYMLEDKSEGTRYIVGENYNLSEGEIENAEIYDNKEEADKDYLDRCEIMKDGEEVDIEETTEQNEE